MKFKVRHHSALDNPARWNQRLKPYFDVQGYQDRIDQLVGTNKDGKSIVRLVWGQEVWQRAFSEETPRYWTRRRKQGSEYVYWTVPRWMLEKRIEPEQYVDAWEASRWSMTDTDGTPIDKGPPPEDYYLFAYLCAEHEESSAAGNGWPPCCDRAYYTDRTRCWGRYRPPSDFDLQLVAQAVRQMEADKYRDPYRPLTKAELAEVELNANMQADRAAQEFAEYEAQMMADSLKLHGHRVFEGPNSFHDMHITETGLYIPE